MLFNKKDYLKFSAIVLIIACAVLVCNLFLNYYIDLTSLSDLISEEMKSHYDAMVTSSISVAGISGGSMTLLSIVMVVFYIKNYIDSHSKELGTLKALGYNAFSIARKFWIFGVCVLVGGIIGYACSFMMMNKFYDTQNADSSFIYVDQNFNSQLIIYLIILPTIIFLLISILYALLKLKSPALSLIRGEVKENNKKIYIKEDNNFLKIVSKCIIRQKKSIMFFAIFAPFCFSANIQMGITMEKYTTPMMRWLMIGIGFIIAVLIMILSLSSLVKENEKNISLMNINGYSFDECKKAVLEIYRPWAYVGFVIGTFYQMGLIMVMVNIVFKDMSVEKYSFSFVGLLITLVLFVIFYELCIYIFAYKIKKINIKKIMLE